MNADATADVAADIQLSGRLDYLVPIAIGRPRPYAHGLAGRCSGNPALPTCLGRLLTPVFVRANTRAERDTEYIQSSAGIAVFVADRYDKPTWIETSRTYQRFALQATALAIRTAFINQPIEVLALRGPFEKLLGLDGQHAKLAARFGHGELAPYSLRRPIDEVIEA